ncbi:MAG: deoxyribodipyrimidine photo-lyase [Actinomycetota bacterium]
MTDPADPVVFWFRRDLRLADNQALHAATLAGSRPCLGLFVIDDALWGPSGPNRRAYLAALLTDLNERMGGRLVVRCGDPAEVVVDVARTVGSEEVWATADFGPYGRRRDAAVAEALAGLDGRLVRHDSPYAVAPGSVVSGSGGPYQVYTPFSKAWRAFGWADPIPETPIHWIDGIGSDSVPPVDDAVELPLVGEAAAHERLDAFLAGPVHDYHERRDLPAELGTSKLSPDLKWGTLHPRQILDRLGESPGEEVYRKELAWREFYADVLARRPETARANYQPKMDAMVHDVGPVADDRFSAWCEGRTGYPIVDAGMRQLLTTGWMHNRVRMISASFLVKDLHIAWPRGARWFMRHLVDGDLASNNHGWQWVAGTGTDAAPYFRIFNPITQGRRFDPSGAYLRHWLPELAHLPDKRIHEPWTDPSGAPAGYPAPIVDHGTERDESLARYSAAKERWS